MNQQINVNIRMDRDLKERADTLFNSMGLNMTTAVNTFVRQCLREESIPFQIKPYNDYKSKVEQSMLQADEGRLTTFDIDELAALEGIDTADALGFINSRREKSNR